MKQLLRIGLEKRVFTLNDVMELIYGKIEQKIVQILPDEQCGVKLNLWQVNNFDAIPLEIREEIVVNNNTSAMFINYIHCALNFHDWIDESFPTITTRSLKWSLVYQLMISQPMLHASSIFKEFILWHNWGVVCSHQELMLAQQHLRELVTQRSEIISHLSDDEKQHLELCLQPIPPSMAVEKDEVNEIYKFINILN